MKTTLLAKQVTQGNDEGGRHGTGTKENKMKAQSGSTSASAPARP